MSRVPCGRGGIREADSRYDRPVAEQSLIAACSDEEKAAVLDAALSLHPEIAADAERLARAVLDGADSDDIADEVIDALSPLDDLPDGAPAAESANVITLGLETHLAAIDRRARAGLDDSAATVALGVLRGLYEYRDAPACDTFETAEEIERLLTEHGIELAPEDYDEYLPDWSDDPAGGDDDETAAEAGAAAAG